MNPTAKNLLMLTRFQERMRENGNYNGFPALTAYDLRKGERYHAERLVRLGFLHKARSPHPEYGAQPVTIYFIDASCRENPFPYKGMRNKRMQEKLVAGEAIDLSTCAQSGYEEYLLGRITIDDLARVWTYHEAARLAQRDTIYVEGKDYCNARTEQWIWSIGIHAETGKVWASHQSNKYRNPAFICIWLR